MKMTEQPKLKQLTHCLGNNKRIRTESFRVEVLMPFYVDNDVVD